MASKVEGGRFAKQCGTSSMHSYWKIQPNQKIVQRTKIRKEQLSVLDKVHKNELHSTRVSYCIGCLAFAEKTCTECAGNKCIETVDTESQTEIQKLVDAFCQTELLDLPKPEDLTPDERKQLAFNLGKCESKRVHEDCKSLTSEYKDLDVLMKLNIDVYKRKRNKVVLAFLDGISQENSPKKYDIRLQLPPQEAGDALCVKHLTDKIFELTGIPGDAQRLIYKGRSLKDGKEELIGLGLSNGAKVMLIGKKPVPADDKDTKALKDVENAVEKQAKKLSDLTYELDGVHRGFLDKSKQPEVLKQKEKDLLGMSLQMEKLMTTLDSLRFDESNKESRAKRKSLVDKIHVLLDRVDGLSCGLEEFKEKNPSLFPPKGKT